MNPITDILLPAVLALIMLGMGLSLTAADFSRVVRHSLPLSIGLGSIVIVLPLLGFAVASAFGLTGALAIGIVLVAACPGGTFSNLLTYYGRGDLALSVSLTAIGSLICVGTIPLFVGLALPWFMGQTAEVALPFLDTVRKIFVLTVVPLAVGMTVNAQWPQFARRWENRTKNIAAVVIVAIFIYLLVTQRDTLAASLERAFLPVLSLNLASATMGIAVSRLVNVRKAQRTAIVIEHVIKQEGTGIFVAVTLLGNAEMALPLILNSWVGLFVGIVLLFLWSRRAPSLEKIG